MSRIYSKPLGIYPYTCTCISSWQSYPNNSNHKWVNTQPNTTLSRPIPRSGWRVSLRLKGLAQAKQPRSGEPPLPRWGLKKSIRKQCGISLRRDPSCLGEMLACSKIWAGRLGDLSHKLVWANPRLSHLGETGSPRRDWLAWARLTGLATVSPTVAMFFKPTKHTKYSHASKRRIKPYNQQPTQRRPKRLELKTLTSRTWKRANKTSTRDLGAHQLKKADLQNWQNSEGHDYFRTLIGGKRM